MRVRWEPLRKNERAEDGSKEIEGSEGVAVVNEEYEGVALDRVELHRTN